MFRHTTVKKSLILLVAALLCITVALAACSEKPFTPNFTANSGEAVGSNGGIAVTYGDYVYYVNGYESNVNAENTYVDTNDAPRIGSVVRIHKDKLAEAIAINENSDLSSSKKSEEIAKLVRENTDVVVPNIYYSGNSTTPELNGIFIFNNRLYILTPNDQLTAGGNPQTTQSVLMSFDLNGANAKRHFTFTSNAAQVWLYQDGNDVKATYLLNSELHVLDVASGEDVAIKNSKGENETVSTVKFDVSENSLGQCIFFLDSDGSICKLAKGATQKTVLVDNSVGEDEEAQFTYTISSVSNGFVYYTVADSQNSSLDGTQLFYTNSVVENGNHKVALDTANVPTYGWKDNKVIVVRQNDSGYYGLYVITEANGSKAVTALLPGFNASSISINKIDGDDVYYTAASVMYKKNLAEFFADGADVEALAETLGTPYAYSMSTSATGWALPDVVMIGDVSYVFSLSNDSVSVVKFDAEKKTNSAATTLTKTVESESED